MSAVYENEEKEVCVALCENDYVKITTDKSDVWLKIKNVGGKLSVENIEKDTKNKESK